MLEIIFPFEPVAWQRVKRSRFGFAYVPDKTKRYKQDIALWASKYAPEKPFPGAIRIDVLFYLPRPRKPKSFYPIVRPDLDNYLKGVMDALNGILWRDDSQIVSIRCEKKYALQDESLRAILRVYPLHG